MAGDGAMEDSIRSCWLTAPVLAAAVDLTTDLAPEQTARCDEFLGWAPDAGCDTITVGDPVNQVWIGIDTDQLEAIQRTVELVPRQLLSLDSLVAANFEWLFAEKNAELPSPTGGGCTPEIWFTASGH